MFKLKRLLLTALCLGIVIFQLGQQPAPAPAEQTHSVEGISLLVGGADAPNFDPVV